MRDFSKLELYKWLSEQQHKTIMESEEVNDEIMKSMAGSAGERIIADLLGGIIISAEYDVVTTSRTSLSNGIFVGAGKRVEVKTCVTHTTTPAGKSGANIAYSLTGKEEHTDFIALVDLRDGPDKARITIIPTDIFFADGHFMGNNERFAWSGTYNQTDKARIDNTNLFLKYEVINERIN